MFDDFIKHIFAIMRLIMCSNKLEELELSEFRIGDADNWEVYEKHDKDYDYAFELNFVIPNKHGPNDWINVNGEPNGIVLDWSPNMDDSLKYELNEIISIFKLFFDYKNIDCFGTHNELNVERKIECNKEDCDNMFEPLDKGQETCSACQVDDAKEEVFE